MTVFLLHCGDSYALHKRPDSGLLAGLWEFPHIPGKQDLPQVLAQLETWGITPDEVERSSEKSHIFTHVQWEMRGWYIRCRSCGGPFVWAPPEQYALPTAFRIFYTETL